MRIVTHLLAFVAGAIAMLAVAILGAVMPLRFRRKPEPFEEPGGGW